jgi:hypothetical protein
MHTNSSYGILTADYINTAVFCILSTNRNFHVYINHTTAGRRPNEATMMVLLPLLLLLASVTTGDAAAATVLRVEEGEPVDPYLFGYCAEAYIGITLIKLLTDTAGVAAARALNAQVLRYPGGTLSNTWDPMKGQYVEPSPFPKGYPSGYNKWQAWGKDINAHYPQGTFTAEQYLQPGNLGSVTKRTLWDLNVYSFNTSQTCDQIGYIGSLPGQQEPGVILELGNE